MSSTLYLEPVKRKKKVLSDQLKLILQRRYGTIDAIFNEDDRPYFLGLLDSGIEDAKTIIEAIEKHGEIHLIEQF